METLRLTQLAEQTRSRSEQTAADLAEVDALLEELQERHDFEDREPSVPPNFIHFDERRRQPAAPKMRR